MSEAFLAYTGGTENPDWSDREAVIDHVLGMLRVFSGGSGHFNEATMRDLVGHDVDRTANVASSQINHFAMDVGEPFAAGSARSAPRRLWSTAKRTPCSPSARPRVGKEDPRRRAVVLEQTGHELPRRSGTSLSLPYYGTRLGGGRDEGLLRAWRFEFSTGRGGGTAWWNPLPHSAWPPGPWSCRAASLLRAPLERLGDMYADADAVGAALGEEDDSVVLVGHSYEGMVITDAASGQENVKRLVYVTSVMPERGETLASFGGSELRSVDGPARRGRHDGHKGRARARRVHAGLRRGDGDGGSKRLTTNLGGLRAGPALRRVAEALSTYVVCTEDRATPPDAQRGYARRADRVVELLTGHHPMLSRPELLARVIAEAV